MTMFRRCVPFVFLIGSGLISCGSPKPGDPNYVQWVRDYKNGMHVRYEQNNLVYDVQFQPAEYAWMLSNGTFDREAFEADRAEFNDIRYFVLNIRSADGQKDVISLLANGNETRMGELLYYFSYRFQNDISLQEGGNEKAVALYHYEQHGTKSFVLGFQGGTKPSADVVLTIKSPVIDSTPVIIKVSTDSKAL